MLQHLRRSLVRNARVAAAYAAFPRAAVGAIRRRADFETVERFCLFLGYPRSGHTIVGAMLTAHRNAIVAHELDALQYLSLGFGRHQIFSLLTDRDRWFVRRKCEWTGYSYAVPNQWQGRAETLRVIGDKKGASTTRRLSRRPGLLDELRHVVRVPLRVIHVTRHPLDNIATMALRESRTIDAATARYFSLCDTVRATIARLEPSEICHLRHEELIGAPAATLAALCRFLALTPSPDYLDDCASIVYASPSRSRDTIGYSSDDRARIQDRLDEYRFLEAYRDEG